MIIQQLSDRLRGYLQKQHEGAIAPFFPTVNMAVRRAALADIGGFDESLVTSEDIDFCIRALDSRWELFYNPDIRVEHAARPTVRALMKQWFDYGLYHSRLFHKHNQCSVEILLPSPWHETRSFTAAFFLPAREGSSGRPKAIVFVTSFAILHLALAGALASGALGFPVASAAATLVAAAAAGGYFAQDLATAAPLAERLRNAGLRYLVNLAMVGGGLLGGLRDGFLYVDAAVDF
jgi:hypothetical protein